MNVIKRVLALLFTFSLLLLPACGTQTAPAATAPPEPTAAPTASPTPAAEPGRLLDRTGQALDLTRYSGLSGAEEAFAHDLQSGNDVSLTIDLALQQQAQTLLADTLGDSGGAAVMVEVSTGAPLVIASHGRSGNRALLSAYQPTNLFLPCTAIAGLHSHIITPESVLPCEGVYNRYEADGCAPECWIWSEGYTHPEENVTTALRDSCYCYFYTVGNELGNMMLVDCAESLGLGQPTGIELPEATGSLASITELRKAGGEWRIGDTLEAAVGRGENCFSPLQMAEYCAAIANKGQRYSASVLSSVTARDGTVLYTRQPRIIGNVLKEKEQELAGLLDGWRGLLDANWDAIHQGMYAALNDQSMNENNAYIWQDCPWQVAGMANRISVGSHAPYEDQVPCRGLFMGFAPYEAPQVAIFVVTEEAESYASQQIARQLLDFYIEKST